MSDRWHWELIKAVLLIAPKETALAMHAYSYPLKPVRYNLYRLTDYELTELTRALVATRKDANDGESYRRPTSDQQWNPCNRFRGVDWDGDDDDDGNL